MLLSTSKLQVLQNNVSSEDNSAFGGHLSKCVFFNPFSLNRLVIRFYASHLDAVENDAQSSGALEGTATAALQIAAMCFTVVAENLGSRHLMRLISALYSVAVAPKPLSEDDVDKEAETEANQVECGNADVDNSPEGFALNQSRALTAIVKLFKVSEHPSSVGSELVDW